MKRKKDTKNHFLGLAAALALLAAAGLLGRVLGVFASAADVTAMIRLDKTTLLELAVMLGFMAAANSLLQILLGFFAGRTGRTGTLATVFSSLVKYGIVLISFCWGMTLLGVDVSTVFASVGIVALILGFGAESLVADLVTGVFIIFENQFNIGDIIEVDGYRGVVDSIGIRTVSIKDSGSNIKVINNSDLKNIINRSNQGSVAVSTVGVSYSTDLEELEKKLPAMLEAIKAKHPDVFTGKIAYLGVEELAAYSVVLKFMAEVAEADYFSGRRILNKELKCAFDKAGIQIPAPQLEVHTR
ncbi:MAG: mechanosensitive ion channel family protein [Oscillospiraceae bacterium]|nr:mechanosensitive ion channel family protein [Oscillospiraceae bacterium]